MPCHAMYMYAYVHVHTCGELNCILEFQSSKGYIIEEPGFAPEVTRPFSLFLGWGLGMRLVSLLLIVASLGLGMRIDTELTVLEFTRPRYIWFEAR